MSVYNVFSSQYNDNYVIPYSIAALVSYIKSFKYIDDKYKFHETFILKNELNYHVDRASEADMLLCSCYTWNWQITKALAKQFKTLNPECLIIFGGPHVPDDAREFLNSNSYVDLVVHGEGEYVLKEIFDAHLSRNGYELIRGTESIHHKAPPQARIMDLDTLPSPYLTGAIWDVVDREKLRSGDKKWMAVWETTRGCPFQCTYCDWGSAIAQKMRKRDEETLYRELDWFKENDLNNFWLADSNFGIFKDRDTRIATQIANKSSEEKPLVMKVLGWAKIPLKRVLPIANIMRDQLGKGMELALQTLDITTLKTIKRHNANLKFEDMSDLSRQLNNYNLQGYIELILGLPGETVDSFKDNVCKIFSDKYTGGPDGIYELRFYCCQLLPNAEMNSDKYKNENNVKTREIRAYSSVGTHINEFEDLITTTSSYDIDDYKNMLFYTWMVQVFHMKGILYNVCHYAKNVKNISIRQFYDTLENYLLHNDVKNCVFHAEKKLIFSYIDTALRGDCWWDHEFCNDSGFTSFEDMFNGTTNATIGRFDEDAVMYRLSKTKLLRYMLNELDFELPEDQRKCFLSNRGINNTLEWIMINE